MEKAYAALSLSDSGNDQLRQARALLCIAAIDIRACRDTDAWQAARAAEEIARSRQFPSELASSLVTQARLCSYAEISPETGRNQEGIAYATEALSIARERDDWKNQADACFALSSLYVNLNRWSDPIDDNIYRTAGEYIDMGEALAKEHNLEKTASQAIIFRSRWLQQGGRNQEAIQSFTAALESLPESEHLTASNLLDHLMNLYIRVGDNLKAVECHNSYVYHQQAYLAQLAAQSLENIQANHEVAQRNAQIQRRERQVRMLIIFSAIAFAAIMALLAIYFSERRKKRELGRMNAIKEDLVNSLTKELQQSATEALAKAELKSEDIANYLSLRREEKKEKISATGLSEREIQVIQLSGKGLTAAQIAEQLFISVHTVNTHRQRIYAKLGVKNVSGMLNKATELGII